MMGGNFSSFNTGETTEREKTQPLWFHFTHGDNITLSSDRRICRRNDSFCKGIVFGHRPIRVDEVIFVRFVETSSNWSGVLRFGFTSNDPALDTVRRDLPRYACPDLTNKAGNWAKALGERYADLPGSILYYYVTANGDVRYGINNEDKGVFFSGVNTSNPIWPLLDVYGNTIAIELLDTKLGPHLVSRSNSTAGGVGDITRRMQSVSLDESTPVPPVVHHNYAQFQPAHFHTTHGFNVQVSPSRTIASRLEDEFCNAYVFISRPIRLGEKFVVQVLRTESVYVGGLGFGLTACDPNRVSPREFPNDSDLLIDRSEYWVVNKDIANTPQQGDELSFFVNHKGEVHYSRNGGQTTIVMYVDISQPLWMFFDVYGNTQAIRLIGCIPAAHNRPALQNPSATSPPSTVSVARAPPRPSPTYASPPQSSIPANIVCPTTNIPPPMTGAAPMQTPPHPAVANYPTTVKSAAPGSPPAGENSNECVICYERLVDCVLYTCGHMCMCYACADLQWRNGEGLCPICRARIRDVIRTYRA